MNYFENEKRPVIKITWSRWEVLLEVCAAAILILQLGLLTQAWPNLPESVPSHFGFSGKPDAWSGKGSMLFAPCISLGLYLLMTIVSRYPHTFNYLSPITEENAREQYKIGRLTIISIKAELVAIFTFIEWRTIEVAMQRGEGMGNLSVLVNLGILFGTVGFFIYKASKIR